MAAPESSFPIRRSLFFIALGLLLVVKLWTTQYQDTKLSSGMHDDAWFTWKAEHGYWNIDSYSELSYIKEPLFPLYIKALNELGIPLRLGNDICYGLALMLLATAMLKRTGLVSLSLILYALLLFHPYGLAVFTRSISDALFTILTVLWLIPLLFIFRKDDPPEKRWLVLWSLISGLMIITRPEGIWVMASTLLVIAWSVYQILRASSWKFRSPMFLIRLAIALLLILGPTFAVIKKVKKTNADRAGFYAIAEQAEPHYQRALKTLMSVRPDQPVRYAFVQLETLRRLSEQSPAVQAVYEKLAGPIGQKWSSYVHADFHPGPGEMGGHFQWAFREAVASLGHYESPQTAQDFYDQLTQEVDALIQAGTFEKRWVPSTGLSQVYSPFSSEFFQSMKRILNRTWGLELQLQQDDPGVFEPLVDLYNTTTLRSSVHFQNKDTVGAKLVLRGWIYTKPPIPLDTITGMLGPSEAFIDATIYLRDDVLGSKNPELVGTIESRFGFYIEITNKHLLDRLRFVLKDGSFFEVPIPEFEQPGGGFFILKTTSEGLDAEVCVDYNTSKYYVNKLEKLDSFTHFYESITPLYPVFLSIAFLALGVATYCLRKQLNLHYLVIVLILLGIFMLRFMMYAMIDYTAFPGDDLRYLFPSSVFLYTLPFMLFALLLEEPGKPTASEDRP